VAQFASSDDLAARLGQTLTEDEVARADTLLELASGIIVDEAKQEIELGSTTFTRRSVYGDRFRLPQRPVVSVDEVQLALLDNAAEVIPATSWYLDGDEVVRVGSMPSVASEMYFGHSGRGWLGPSWSLTVTYTHGFEEIPPAIKALTLEMVVRVWVNPGSVAQEGVGDTSTLYYYASNTPDASGLLLTRVEARMLKKLFGRPSSTVTLR